LASVGCRTPIVVLISLIAGLAVAVPAAEASQARAHLFEIPTYRGGAPVFIWTAVLQADPGEANDITIVEDGARDIHMNDVGAPLRAGEHCSAEGPHAAVCDLTDTYRQVYVMAGDGDDRAGSTNLDETAFISGGPGNDTVSTGVTGGTLYAGPGDDTVIGGTGNDRIYDGDLRKASDDLTTIAGGGRDAFDGGGGDDRIIYEGRTRPLRIDLRTTRPVSGAPGEGDSLHGIEQAEGGSGDDRLIGDAGPNRLDGMAGDDVLSGGSGDDQLADWDGSDVFRGGAGDDSIYLSAGAHESNRANCGPGDDTVWFPRVRDFVAADCEHVNLNGIDVDSLLPLRRNAAPDILSAAVDCVNQTRPCRAWLEVRAVAAGRPVLGRRSVLAHAGGRDAFRLRLSPTGAAYVQRHGTVRVRVRLRAFDGEVFAYTTELRALA
jgi:hypothetical protein